MDIKDVEGKVKWFSQEKGYGFLTDYENIDYYFHKDQVEENVDISIGDKVCFTSYIFKNSPRAKKIKVIEKVTNDKIKCKNCSQEILPKIITGERIRGRFYDVYPKYISCPICSYVFEEIKEDTNHVKETLLSSITLIGFCLILIIIFTYFINFR